MMHESCSFGMIVLVMSSAWTCEYFCVLWTLAKILCMYFMYIYKYIICNQREREREIQCREVSSDWLQPLHSPTTFEEPWISMCTGVQHPKSMTMWQVFCLEGNIPRILQWKTRPFPYCCYDELIMRYVLFPNNNNIDIRLLMSYFTDYEYLR